MKVIGKRNVSFTTKDGVHIEGTNLFVTYQDQYTEGYATEKVFCSSRITVNHVKLGDEIRVLYNKYGKPDMIEVLK